MPNGDIRSVIMYRYLRVKALASWITDAPLPEHGRGRGPDQCSAALWSVLAAAARGLGSPNVHASVLPSFAPGFAQSTPRTTLSG